MLFLSLGENCLTDDILRRNNIKSFSTPYSPCRSNIDYALALEDCGYNDFLDPYYLTEGVAAGKRVIRSKLIVDCEKIYDSTCSKGFEFTHHDLINNSVHRDSFQRKINRLNDIKFQDDIVFLYHHRRNSNTDLSILRDRLKKFPVYYKGKNNIVLVVCFYQTVVTDLSERRLQVRVTSDDFLEFDFLTTSMWGGNDPDVFWGRVDDDLIQEMVIYIKEFVSKLSCDNNV